MSDLAFIERTKLERLFQMGGGYVLDFSNRTLAEFVAESTGRDIYDAKYDYASGSKANRIRAFWTQEPNHLVGKLVHDLLEYCRPPAGDSVVSRLVGKKEMAHSSGGLTTNPPSGRAAAGGMRHGET